MSNFRWICGCMFRYKGWVLLSMIVLTAGSMAFIATTWLQGVMIDDVIKVQNGDRFWIVFVQIALAYVLHSILFTVGPYVSNLTFARMREWLSARLLGRMFKLPISEFQKERSANYVYHFTDDMEQTSDLMSFDIPNIIMQVITAVVLVAIVAYESPLLIIVIMAFCIPYVALGKKFAAPRKKVSGEMNKHKSTLLVLIEEGISATREVLAFRREKWEKKQYGFLFNKYYDSSMSEARIINKQFLWSEPLRLGSIYTVLVLGGLLVLDGKLELGAFVVVFRFTSEIMRTLNNLYTELMKMSGKLASVDRFRGVLEGNMIQEGNLQLTEPITSLSLDAVKFKYEDREDTVLSGINMDFPIGKKIALVGTSGGGKSTITSLMVRYFDPVEGQIMVNHQPLSDIQRNSWSQRLAVVFQEPYLFPDTIRTNLTLGVSDIAEERIFEICKAMQIHNYIVSLPEGYETIIGERGITLSGGQRQRLSLARAMLYNPEILILDEATSSLDMETERVVQRALDEYRRGRTTIVIAHRLSTILNADLIYVLHKGHVAEQGTHEELMSLNAIYHSLVTKHRSEEFVNELAG